MPDERLVVLGCEDAHFGARKQRPQLPRDLDAIDHREGVVDDGDVGLGLSCLLDGLFPVAGNPHHLKGAPAEFEGNYPGEDAMLEA
jgi:hypothetical protein